MEKVKKVFLDFESRSQADIWECGAWVYSQHPSTEILCLCYAVDNGPVKDLNFRSPNWDNETGIWELNQLVKEGAEFHAHNAFFERSMWKNILTPRYGALPIPIKQWRCTAAKASAHALPKKLEKAAEALETKFRKDMSGSKTMMYLAKSTGTIEQSKMDRLIQYCKTDVEVEREIDQRLPDLDEKEQKVWFLDQYINDTGVSIDLDAVHKAAECVDKEIKTLTAELNRLTGGEITAGTQRDKIKEWLEKKGVQLPNLQKKTVADALAGTTDDNKKVLLLRQQLSLTSNAKYNSLLAATSPDGRVRDILVYHGASTGRWSGKLVQIQNLVKPTEEGFDNRPVINVLKNGGYDAMGMFYGDNMLSVLSSCIRGMFIPSPGHEMFITDFAAIEARVVMWLADDRTGLKMFEDADKDPKIPDIYVKTAWKIFRDQTLTKKDKPKRQVGKQTVLGCGFGMGAKKFWDTCTKYGIDLGVADTQIEVWGETILVPRLAVDAVTGYRSTFSKVPVFWTEMEQGAINCVRTGRPVQVGKILWYMDGEFLRMKLPIGRTLAYHRPKIDGNKLTFMSADPVTKRYVPESTWGGTLVENATQAVARDLMVSTMFTFATTGFRILFTVHDELVLEAPVGSKSEADVLEIVRTIPSWAKGCPVNAECEKVDRYKK